MFALVSGQLFRDPVSRVAKNGNGYATATLRSADTWVNVIAFDDDAQSELLRLEAGDSLSVQGLAKISIFKDRHGDHKVSLDLTASRIFALRQPPKPKERTNRRRLVSK